MDIQTNLINSKLTKPKLYFELNNIITIKINDSWNMVPPNERVV
jgi:hypothetical protein